MRTEIPAGAPKYQDLWNNEQLWDKYEAIAMHFNDLLLRLRTQALAGVAALGTIAGVLVKSDVVSLRASWAVATAVLIGLSLFWLAIWIIDFTYYNRLLLGAVNALLRVEKGTAEGRRVSAIELSTAVENAVAGTLVWEGGNDRRRRFMLGKGRWAFYVIVFVVLLLGAFFSFRQWANATDQPVPAQIILRPAEPTQLPVAPPVLPRP